MGLSYDCHSLAAPLACGNRWERCPYIFEDPAKIRELVEARRIAYIRDGQLRPHEHADGMKDAKIGDIAVERLACPFLEQSTEG